MLVLIYFSLCFLLLVKHRSKWVFNVSILFLLLLFCFCGDIADRENYESWFNLYDYSILNNLGFYFIVKFIIYVGGGPQLLYVLIGTIYLLSISYVIRKLSHNPNYVLAYYMLGLFFLDVVQLKNTFGHVIILWALYFYFTMDKTFQRKLFFIFGVLLATLIHPSLFFYIIFLFVDHKPKRVMLYSITISILLYNFIYHLLGYIGPILGKEELINIGFYSDKMVLLTQLILLFFYFVVTIIYLMRMKSNRCSNNNISCLLLNVLFLMLPLIPLIKISIDFRRFFFFLSLIVVILFGKSLKNNSQLYRVLFLVYALILLYFFTLGGNYRTVFLPLFQNNILF